MVSLRPAFSAAFMKDRLAPLAPVDPIDGITRAWAWDGLTGRGVKVEIVESGIDPTHPEVVPIKVYLSISEE